MAKLIYHVAITADQFIADPDGRADESIFLYEGDHAADFMADIQRYDAVLMGGKTYEVGFQFGIKPGEPSYKGLKHYVFSSSMQFESNAEVELVQSSAADFIDSLKRNEQGRLWLCGGRPIGGLFDRAKADRSTGVESESGHDRRRHTSIRQRQAPFEIGAGRYEGVCERRRETNL